MGMPVKLSDELVESAREEAANTDRSITGQIEHWAKIGRSVETVSWIAPVLLRVLRVLRGGAFVVLDTACTLNEHSFSNPCQPLPALGVVPFRRLLRSSINATPFCAQPSTCSPNVAISTHKWQTWLAPQA